MSEYQTDKTPSLSPTKPKRSSLKGANMMDANEIMKYSRKKRHSVSFQLGANFQFNKLRTTFKEMKPEIVNPIKKKSFIEKRKQSIQNEFALAKELLKKQKSIDEIENETEVKENTSKNAQVGKEIKESDSEDVSDENNKDGKKQNKKNRNNISLYNIQNKIFSYENHNIAKKLNQNELSYKTINDNSKNKNNNKCNENNASKNKKEINTKNNNYLSPNKKVYIKKFDKKFSNKLNNAIIVSENLCDKTFSHNNDGNNNNINNNLKDYTNNNNNKKEGNTTEKRHKSLPYQIEQFILNKDDKDDNINLLEKEKPLSVINYIAKKLVTSSFCGNLNLEFNKNNMTKRNNEIYDNQLIISNINLLNNKENNKEQNKTENNKNTENHNFFNNDGNFKNLISVLNQKFKNYLNKENSKNGIQHTQKNRSMKNNKYILNNLEYNNYFSDDIKYKNEFTPTQKTQKSMHENKIDFLSNNNNTNIDNYSYSYSYNINNMISHYNNCLDISTNYDPGIDSKGESSLDKILSINKNELRHYSICLDKKKNENNMNMNIINFDYIRNNGGVNTSHNKYSKNINVISEDDELNEFSKDKENNNIKCFKNKNKNSLGDKRISINLTATFNPVNTDIKKYKK